MIRKLLFLLSFILLLSGLQKACAQKVGLVLSGGGSKGVTHIGVIRALEEAGIPIDYVAGTSMGAIIGGLYASGYSPDEMEEIVTSKEFDYWVSGKIDKKYAYFFKKPEPDASWVDFKFRVDSVITPLLPTNIVSPVLMDFVFMEIFAGVGAAANYNFDSLMVPYRCMASDIARAEPVTLKNGDLGSAVRASMTYPFYFKPIRINGTLLFDGGMYNNFPANVMLDDFFPDIIIGSQAASNNAEPEANNLVSQLQNMLMQKSDYSVICDNSVLIKPQLKKVSVLDFSNTRQFIDSGYVAAQRLIPQIRKFVVDSVSKDEMAIKRERFLNKKPPLYISNFLVSGLSSGQFEYVNRILRKNIFNTSKIKNGNKSNGLSLELIKPEYFKLLTEDKIEHIYPQMKYNASTGFYDLILDVQAQNNLLASVGGAVTSSAVNELFLQFQYSKWNRNSFQAKANGYFGRFYNSGFVETRLDFPRKTPFFVRARFVFNKFNYFRTNTYFFEDEDPFFLIERDNYLSLATGFPVTNDGMLTFEFKSGLNRDDYYQTNAYSRSDTLDKTMLNFNSPGVTLEFNTLNNKEYPSSGARLALETFIVFAVENYHPGSTSLVTKGLRQKHTWLQAGLT
ncbi:MAG TPA: patatin-like phospholipase family protein, partial [Lentimicrobium sp.]|nr:patatin-like phospholipase family protein [Lentimicrobium sp.]